MCWSAVSKLGVSQHQGFFIGGLFFFPHVAHFFGCLCPCFFAFLLLCMFFSFLLFPASLLLCFFVSLLLHFSASLLFYSFLLLCFFTVPLLCFLLFCFLLFPASLLLWYLYIEYIFWNSGTYVLVRTCFSIVYIHDFTSEITAARFRVCMCLV